MFYPIDIVIRVVLALLLLFCATKFLNNRSLSSITYLNYIATATLGTIAGNLAFNIKIHILNFVLAGALITLILALASYVSLIYRPLRKILTGNPVEVIRDGKILEHNMADLNFSFDYLNEKLREQNVFDIGKVAYGILEPNGQLSVVLKSSDRPLTPKDLDLKPRQERVAIEIILDGKIVRENLDRLNRDPRWLSQELRKKGFSRVEDVAFAALSTNGNLYIDAFEDDVPGL